MIPPIVSPDWLVAAAGREDLVVADVRWYLDGRSGRAAYETGHLPGARFVDIDHDLSDHSRPAVEGRHPMPDPERFAAAMSHLGIGDGTTVVAYDDSGGGTAGRLVVMLRSLGHAAALLDGGLAAWEGPLESGPGAEPRPARFTARAWPAERFASADEVAVLAADPAARVLDARAADRYRGDHEPIDPRAGHVPGARNAPWAANLDPESKRFRSPAELREHYGALGVDAATEVVCYCGSGVSACADVIGLEYAGLPVPRLFVGSWSGWSADPARPAATGDA